MRNKTHNKEKILNPGDDEESNALGIVRDQETLDKEKKKKKNSSVLDVVNKIKKINQKIQIESMKKFTESDEEILDEVQQYKEKIDREIEDDIKIKKEEFKKIAMKNIEYKDENINKAVGGLISNPEKRKEKAEDLTYFEEIINNINQENFDIEKYTGINKLLTKKNDDKWDKRNNQEEVDYSKGGLQTFEKKKEFGLILNKPKTEEDYFDEEEEQNVYGDYSQEYLLNKKRVRNNTQENLCLNGLNVQKKVYGATLKPKSRNVDEEDIDEKEVDAFFMPSEKCNMEHDINTNPFKTDNDEFN